MKLNNVYFITNIFPHYREALWREILSSKSFNAKFFYSKYNPLSIKEGKIENCSFDSRINNIKGFWLFNKYLIWQSDIVKVCLSKQYNSIVFLGEMNILSNWVGALICRIRKKRVFFWSHGFYGNESSFKHFFRKLFYKIADEHIVYENRGKSLMIKSGFKGQNIHIIYNSLDYEKQKLLFEKLNKTKDNSFTFFRNNTLPVLAYIGRLIESKKLDQLINAFKNINKDNQICNLLIVGSGPEEEKLKKLSEDEIISKTIHFYGPCYDESIISGLIHNSICTVSPGNIGLTVINSLSYGTPAITHNNFENQMPEVEVIKEGVTGFFFNENDISSLELALKNMINLKIDFKADCRKVIDENYNPANQVKILEKILLNNNN
jgi:glycosyltransferase involved in cell wall biosynthesis